MSFNFIAAVTICSDFGTSQNKVYHCFHCFPTFLQWSDGNGCHDFSFLNVELSVQLSHSVMCNSLLPHGLQHARPPCPSPTPGVYSSSCPLSQWCHQIISSSVISFSFYLQSFPASGSFEMSQLCIRWPKYWSFSFNISPPMNLQDWFPLGWTGRISLQSKGLWRVFSNTTVQNHQLLGTQLSL